jgi:hypothetical protein
MTPAGDITLPFQIPYFLGNTERSISRKMDSLLMPFSRLCLINSDVFALIEAISLSCLKASFKYGGTVDVFVSFTL